MKVERNIIDNLLPQKVPKKRKSFAFNAIPDVIQPTYLKNFVTTALMIWATFDNPWTSGSIDFAKCLGTAFKVVYPHLQKLAHVTEHGDVVYGNVSTLPSPHTCAAPEL